MFKPLYNCTHFTCQQGYAQNLSSQGSAVCKLRTSRCRNQIQKRRRNQRSNCQNLMDNRKSKGIPKNIYFCFIDYAKAFDCVNHNKLWNIRKGGGRNIHNVEADHITCLLRNLYAGQEATVITGCGTTDWFQIGKGVHQDCTLSPC